MFQHLIRKRDTVPSSDLWCEVASGFTFLDHLDGADRERLRALCGEFLARKLITGAADFVPDETVRLSIAIQACLPILRFDLGAYDSFVEIVVYPSRFLVPREEIDAAGVVHESIDELAGEAIDGGPVVLSWTDTAAEGLETGLSVVIHEFVHKIDLLDGIADGVPPLPRGRRQRWQRILEQSYRRFVTELDCIEASIPRTVDPESAAGDSYYAQLALDPYAATDPAEFFAVAAEAFFTNPAPLARAFPAFYRELVQFFGQNPLVSAVKSPTYLKG